MAWSPLTSSLVKSRKGKTEPFQRSAMEQPRLLGFGKVERGDAGTRMLLAERERVVGAEHHVLHAGDVDQVAQRTVVVHARIEEQLIEVVARIARVVGCDALAPHAD